MNKHLQAPVNYCVIIKRDPENSYYNRAQYRVVMCMNGLLPKKRKVMRMGSVFAIQTTTHYQPNSFVCPRKAMGFR